MDNFFKDFQGSVAILKETGEKQQDQAMARPGQAWESSCFLCSGQICGLIEQTST